MQTHKAIMPQPPNLINIYDQPVLYLETFERDHPVVDEADVLDYLWGLYGAGSTGADVKFCEMFAGPAEYAREMLGRGWDAEAADINETMKRYSAELDKDTGLVVPYHLTDARRPAIGDARYDFVLSPWNSISHLLDNADIAAHLREMSRIVKPGGLYLFTAYHPSTITYPGEEPIVKEYLFDGGITVKAHWSVQRDSGWDEVGQIQRTQVAYTFYHDGQVTDIVQAELVQRWVTAQHWLTFVDLVNATATPPYGEWESVWMFGEMTVPPPPVDRGDQRELVVLLRRKSETARSTNRVLTVPKRGKRIKAVTSGGQREKPESNAVSES